MIYQFEDYLQCTNCNNDKEEFDELLALILLYTKMQNFKQKKELKEKIIKKLDLMEFGEGASLANGYYLRKRFDENKKKIALLLKLDRDENEIIKNFNLYKSRILTIQRTKRGLDYNLGIVEKAKKSAGILLYSAILDSKTTNMCRGLNGKKWDSITHSPINHTTPLKIPNKNTHFNCRSVLIYLDNNKSYTNIETIEDLKANIDKSYLNMI